MKNNEQIQPFVTCYGNNGIAKIEDRGGGTLWWYVKPGFSTLYSFIGEITIKDGARFIASLPVSGMGQPYKALSGFKGGGPKTKGKTYKAVFTGVARDNQGTSSFVVPKCETAYRN
ncbi:hypothetical protein MHB50_01545 [Siminovitchia sp. FSL H7-0308]|uniref:Uncharacterized protein n=1 Tax=Siminovitchia thermophila TaxID=1245522 RepID=A0ABS2R4G1_9BACI|nr:hypothetical protein [Siminovitchia thermophila]MBM7714039.1 hypothetical protein [Siminovitchia thermophila]ONK21636.1 hypothetical protein BLX87_20670 [Bacillus sp. VT-16-64]